MTGRIQYTNKLEEIEDKLLLMSTLVSDAVTKAIDAVETTSLELAQTVINEDKVIDELQNEIEDACTMIIATEQPVAGDLREVVTAIKIVSHLERIGDHARHLAKAVGNVKPEHIQKVFAHFKIMVNTGLSMLKEAMKALKTGEIARAKHAASRDDEIDQLQKEAYNLLLKMMKEDKDAIQDGVTLMFLNRFMERLGDHVTNICEWVCFYKTGEHTVLN